MVAVAVMVMDGRRRRTERGPQEARPARTGRVTSLLKAIGRKATDPTDRHGQVATRLERVTAAVGQGDMDTTDGRPETVAAMAPEKAMAAAEVTEARHGCLTAQTMQLTGEVATPLRVDLAQKACPQGLAGHLVSDVPMAHLPVLAEAAPPWEAEAQVVATVAHRVIMAQGVVLVAHVAAARHVVDPKSCW
jgi:hypothetical protein